MPARDIDTGASRVHYDPFFTDRVIAATWPNAHPRLAEIMPSLIRHLHDFAREVNLTVDEWKAAVHFVSPLSFFVRNDRRLSRLGMLDRLRLRFTP